MPSCRGESLSKFWAAEEKSREFWHRAAAVLGGGRTKALAREFEGTPRGWCRRLRGIFTARARVVWFERSALIRARMLEC